MHLRRSTWKSIETSLPFLFLKKKKYFIGKRPGLEGQRWILNLGCNENYEVWIGED